MGDRRVLEEAGFEMGFEMVDADEGLFMVIGQKDRPTRSEPMSPGPWVTA
jgi:hypothetical protein